MNKVIQAETYDFGGQAAATKTTALPFIGFMMGAVGIGVLIIGIVLFFNAEEKWKVFYDRRPAPPTKEKIKRNRIIGAILMVLGVLGIIASFVFM